MKKTIAALSLLIALPLGLSACASGSTGDKGNLQAVDIVQQQQGTTFPQSNSSSSNDVPAAFWTDGKRTTVDLVTYGPTNCPVVPASIRVVSSTRVDLVAGTYKQSCSSSMRAYTTRFTVPSEVSRKAKVKFTLSQGGDSTNAMDTTLSLTPSPTVADHPKFTAPSPQASTK